MVKPLVRPLFITSLPIRTQAVPRGKPRCKISLRTALLRTRAIAASTRFGKLLAVNCIGTQSARCARVSCAVVPPSAIAGCKIGSSIRASPWLASTWALLRMYKGCEPRRRTRQPKVPT